MSVYTYSECVTGSFTTNIYQGFVRYGHLELEYICHQSGVLVGNTFSLQFPRVSRLLPPSCARRNAFVCFLCRFPDMTSADTGTDLAIGNIGQGFRVICDIVTGNT